MDLSKRLPKAILVTFVAVLVFGTGLGFATAAGLGGGDLPETMQIASPSVGDRWAYSVAFQSDEGSATWVESDRLEFTWEEATVVYDGEGMPHHVQPLHTHSETGEFFHMTGDSRSYVSIEERRIVAGSQSGAFNETRSRSMLPLGLPALVASGALDEEALVEFESSYIGYGDEPVPCGFFSEMQGQEVALDRPVEVRGDCLGVFSESDTAMFRAHEVRRIQGMDTVGFVTDDGRNTTRLWFHPEIPVPVYMEAVFHLDLQELFGDFFPEGISIDLPTDVRYEGSWVLDHFEAGSGAWGDTSGPLPPARPTIVPVPWTRTGPDDSDFDHPFRLSEAFQGAHDDLTYSDLRDFMAQHPDAEVIRARGWTTMDDEATTHGWNFMVWSNMQRLVVDAERRIAHPGTPEAAVQEIAGPRDRYESQDAFVTFLEFTQVAGDLPESAPSVADAARWFESATGRAATAYGFDFTCSFFCWGQVSSTFHVGTEEEEYTPGDRINDEPGRIHAQRHMFHFDPDGHLVLEERAVGEGEAHANLFGSSPSMSYAADVESGWARGGVWSAPQAGVAAGATFAAFLIGAAYWLWPAIKTGGLMGLFSRVSGEQLLEHPVRADIHAAVQDAPGIHYQELVRRIGRGRGVTEHHLRKLQDGGFLVVQGNAGHKCYFPRGVIDHSVMAAVPVLRTKGAANVMRAILDGRADTVTALAAHLGISKSTASHHVRRLRDAGLVAPKGPLEASGPARKALAMAA